MSLPDFTVPLTEIKKPLSELGPFLVESARLSDSADVTVTGTTLTALSGLSKDLIASKNYSFEILLFAEDGGEGVKVDLHGGSATMTEIRALVEFIDDGPAGVGRIEALTDVASLESFATASGTRRGVVRIKGSMTVNAGGTFIPRAAQYSHTSHSLTVKKLSDISIQERL